MTATADTTKKKRPAQPGTPIMLRLQPEQLAALDTWIKQQASQPSRPEAIRQILARALS